MCAYIVTFFEEYYRTKLKTVIGGMHSFIKEDDMQDPFCEGFGVPLIAIAVLLILCGDPEFTRVNMFMSFPA